MKTKLFLFAWVFSLVVSAVADFPMPFDARSEESQTLEGAGYIIQPFPMTSNYVIVSQLFKDNTGNAFFAVEALADPSLKLDGLIGKFVHIKAIRIKSKKKDQPQLGMTSVTEITKWK